MSDNFDMFSSTGCWAVYENPHEYPSRTSTIRSSACWTASPMILDEGGKLIRWHALQNPGKALLVVPREFHT